MVMINGLIVDKRKLPPEIQEFLRGKLAEGREK
jgi:hypothetical protein